MATTEASDNSRRTSKFVVDLSKATAPIATATSATQALAELKRLHPGQGCGPAFSSSDELICDLEVAAGPWPPTSTF